MSVTRDKITKGNYWSSYWSTRINGGHRSQEESFLQKETREKQFHLGGPGEGGGSILDFGCGSADLLVYYAPYFKRVIGADFSESMLKNAGKKIVESGLDNIQLIQADDNSIWEKINQSFDFITSGQVIQYFTLGQVEAFIKKAKDFLEPGGKIIFFDVIDPRIYFLFELGIFQQKKMDKLRIFKSFIKTVKARAVRHSRGLPDREIGYGHLPHNIIKIANDCQFEAQYVCSMYYEYRYHLILTPDV
jgi:cyclopropane fatty-acyl-phospholipid synthase-like methyltransferase